MYSPDKRRFKHRLDTLDFDFSGRTSDFADFLKQHPGVDKLFTHFLTKFDPFLILPLFFATKHDIINVREMCRDFFFTEHGQGGQKREMKHDVIEIKRRLKEVELQIEREKQDQLLSQRKTELRDHRKVTSRAKKALKKK